MTHRKVLHGLCPVCGHYGSDCTGEAVIKPDFEVTNHGSVYLFKPLNANARDWLNENVASEGWQWFGNALVVDHHDALAFAAWIEDAGFDFTEDQYRI